MNSTVPVPPHHPDLYQPSTTPPFAVDSFEQIDDRVVARYREEGYLVVRRAFGSAAVQNANDGLRDCILGNVPGFDCIEFEAAVRDLVHSLSYGERQDAVRKLMHFTAHEPRLRALSHDPRLLAVIHRLLGGRTPHMFQDMALLKPPRVGREKPWHQDHAYFNYPLGTPIVGVWIALDPATIENGCMQLLPGGHREGPVIHFKRRDWQICDTAMLGKQSVAAPLDPGGLLLFDGLLPHGTPHNNSGQRRRAVQFHYSPEDVTPTTQEERMAVFGSEGKDVSC